VKGEWGKRKEREKKKREEKRKKKNSEKKREKRNDREKPVSHRQRCSNATQHNGSSDETESSLAVRESNRIAGLREGWRPTLCPKQDVT
jgi:hypothetical protein